MKKKKSAKKTDAQLREFIGRDLGKDMANSKSAIAIRPKMRQTPTSILLAPEIIEKLKLKAQNRGIGYQTMLKIIVHEHVDDY